ncbi:MAG TPA: YdbL family protein [Methylophilaceae bacterium]|nr:YdbL family protein [Methylophilaceae bacterium]
MKKIISALCLMLAVWTLPAAAEADLEINTQAIAWIKAAMKDHHAQLKPYYDSGAVGLTRDGLVALRDATQVPLSQRQSLNGLIAAQNKSRNELYKEIANANGHPEWEAEVRNTFAQRWIQKAPAGWWYQDASGGWVKK